MHKQKNSSQLIREMTKGVLDQSCGKKVFARIEDGGRIRPFFHLVMFGLLAKS